MDNLVREKIALKNPLEGEWEKGHSLMYQYSHIKYCCTPYDLAVNKNSVWLADDYPPTLRPQGQLLIDQHVHILLLNHVILQGQGGWNVLSTSSSTLWLLKRTWESIQNTEESSQNFLSFFIVQTNRI